MKVSTPTTGSSKQEQPPLSLVPDENEDYVDTKSAHCSIFKLRTNPTDPASALYSFSLMKIDGTQSLRAHIQWIANVKKIHRGLGLDATASVRKHTLNSELCSGEVKTAYENGVSAGCQAALTQLKIDAYNGVARAVGQSDEDWKAAQQAAADLITDVPDPDEASLIMVAGGSLQEPREAEALHATQDAQTCGNEDAHLCAASLSDLSLIHI